MSTENFRNGGVRRREFVAGLVAASLAAPAARAADGAWQPAAVFKGDGDGWPSGWRTVGVANLRRRGGLGILEAGSDVFPNDPRPVAFAVDRRFRDGAVRAVVQRAGAGAGVVLRRTGHRAYLAAIYDGEALRIIRRTPDGGDDLVATLAPLAAMPITIELAASGAALTATLTDTLGRSFSCHASDPAPAPGDFGVLATAVTLLPSGDTVLPSLGNLHLLPYGVQEGEALLGTPVGQAFIGAIRERSTAAFREISVRTAEPAGTTRPSIVAATTGVPVNGGARLNVATDVPARVEIEVTSRRDFSGAHRVKAGRTDDFDAVIQEVTRLARGRRAYWRARATRRGVTTVGPVRSFKVLPRPGSSQRVRIAVAACASQFGPIFDHLTASRPDAFIWQGDLNYPDTHGPLAQSMSSYAGIWRDFLANPVMADLLGETSFAAQRDDHDYAAQDSNARLISKLPWGVAPWESLMCDRVYYRFATGLAEVWVLDQRRYKSDPTAPDTPAKSLLGPTQRAWLLRTLASSRAPFKVICSPCTVLQSANGRDGNWSNGFRAERDLVLEHISKHVSGRTIFLTGDTHVTMVCESKGFFEARACPLDIPLPNDMTLASPTEAHDLRQTPGVAYADDRGHFSLIEISGTRSTAALQYTIVREDGARPYSRRFELPRH